MKKDLVIIKVNNEELLKIAKENNLLELVEKFSYIKINNIKYINNE